MHNSPETKLVVGLMSGTSADGIDASLVKINPDFSIEFIKGIEYGFSGIIRETIFKIFQNKSSPEEICWMNFALGQCFAEAALEVIEKAGLTPDKVDLIGSHGQTIYHKPDDEFIDGLNKKSTMQIGEGAVISEKTGITTVSDFRTADVAAGGQGAPLVSFADEIFFKKGDKKRAVQNIGGIGNVTVIGPGILSFAFDTGPGNVIIDYCANKYFNRKYDKNGELAARGEVDYEWLNKLLKEEYYAKSPPKTTGRELFTASRIDKYLLNAPECPYDIMATVTALTAHTIFNAYKAFVYPAIRIDEVIIGGGGVFNPTLMKMIKNLFAENVKVLKHEDFGIPDRYKEAIAFAMLAYAAFYKLPNNIPSCTGAKHRKILGKISYK